MLFKCTDGDTSCGEYFNRAGEKPPCESGGMKAVIPFDRNFYMVY
jgi:hypothetical protein